MENNKNVFYQILKLLAELYPSWAAYLNRNLSQKKLTCAGYKESIPKNINNIQIDKLREWFKGRNNNKFLKYPPAPLELRQILSEVYREEKENPAPIFSIPILSAKNCHLNRHWLMLQLLTTRKEVFYEDNEHLRSDVMVMYDCFMNNKPLYLAAIEFCSIFKECKRLKPYLSSETIVEKIISVDKRDLLIEKVGAIDIDLLLQFIYESRWHEEISVIVQKFVPHLPTEPDEAQI